MTLREAVDIVKERIRIDKEEIGSEDPLSDFDKFIAEQDDALEIVTTCLSIIEQMFNCNFDIEEARKHVSERTYQHSPEI